MPDMRISDVIKRLEELKQQHGDLICSTQESVVGSVEVTTPCGGPGYSFPAMVMIAGD